MISLIRPGPGHCLPVAGRSYGQALRRIGATDTAVALDQLDRGIGEHGH